MKFLILTILALFFINCSAPRTNIHSGKVTPKGHFKGGFNMSPTIPLNTIDKATTTVKDQLTSVTDTTSALDSSNVRSFSEALLSYSLDPITFGSDIYIRYGVLERLDVGLGYSFSTKIFDVTYQFMGSTGDYDGPGTKGTNGSLGLQYSSQEYELPSFFGSVQRLLKYEFSRSDFLARATFSTAFGEEEKYGYVGYGAACNYTRVKYGFEDDPLRDIVNEETGDVLSHVPQTETSYFAYGPFVNAKVGYKHVFLLVSTSVYYQNYGTYEILGGETVDLSGWTIIPSFGIQIMI